MSGVISDFLFSPLRVCFLWYGYGILPWIYNTLIDGKVDKHTHTIRSTTVAFACKISALYSIYAHTDAYSAYATFYASTLFSRMKIIAVVVP